MFKKMIYLVSFVLVLILAGGVASADPLQQDPGPDGIVSVEAVHYDNNISQGGVQWELVGPTGGFIGIAGMQANGGGNIDTNYAATSPQLDYEIDFVKTGTHYVWIRGWGAGGGDDSCHAGLDGEETPLSNRMTGWNNNYTWANGRYERPEPSQIDIPTTGLHVLNIWMREDGLIIDKIVLTTNPDYIPTGDGPPESTRGPRVTAYNPNPADGATDVPRDVVLSWTPGTNIDKHDVYFDTNPDDVNQATVTVDPANVYQGRIDPNIYTPAQRLELGQTYYWRIDEVNAPPDNTIHKGGLWSFTTELFSYAIQNIIATASSSEEGKGPENTVNGSGLDSTGLLHGNVSVDTMWLSSRDGDQSTWIQYEFDRIYKMHEMWVWNSNDSLEQVIGLGLKDVTIEYSTDGVDFTTLGTTHEFAQGPGTADYAHNTTVDFGGVAAKFVRLTANSNWGGILNQFGLSEVRFFYIPISARDPNPASGATDVGLDVTLSWNAGREAAKHDVYFSDDWQAVVDGTALLTTVTKTSYGPLALDLGTTYFWRVDEVNDAETPTTWQGDVWNFTTHEFLVVDDFEDYDVGNNEIWWAWIDGLGFASHPTLPAHPGNVTGSMVGDETSGSYMEETIVHGGGQSMPIFYDNNQQGKLRYSEVENTLSTQRDWTEEGVGVLSLWFYGVASNAAEPMYVALNGNAVVTHDNPNAAQIEAWTEWTIDLSTPGGFADQGVNLANVNTIAIGLGNKKKPAAGGSGTMYFDDIRLYRLAP
ncbi:MAG: discoidin domain-containing protein [Planctomycetota bacterium]